MSVAAVLLWYIPLDMQGHSNRAGTNPRPSFAAHNILLDDGTLTKPGSPTIESHNVFKAASRTIELVFPHEKETLRLVDLGCLDGGYSVGFARMGFATTGIEVRSINYKTCIFVKENVNLPNLSFKLDNAWNAHKYGPFDVTFCSGLLYHLDKPKKFLDYISSFTSKLLLLHTHFAPEELGANPYRLSDECENEGVRGRWFTEFLVAKNRLRPRARHSSWDNRRSFWLRKEYLLDILGKCGFDLVFEQYDSLGHEIARSMVATDGYYRKQSRCLFTAIRSGSV